MSNQFLKLRRSSVPGKVPTTSSLDFGEIALNTYDGLAFIKKSGSNGEEVVTLGSGTGGVQFLIATGSVSASVSVIDSSIFLIQSASLTLVNVDNTGSLTISGSLNVDTQGTFDHLASVKNNGVEYLKLNGEGVLVLNQYSSAPNAVPGGMYFDTLGELYLGV